jgi:2-methylisocitrate lyase-like PEP mutase family enzyme
MRAVREAASAASYDLVINARIDTFLATFAARSKEGSQAELVPDALRRAHAYLEAGADCVFPILLWEADALAIFTSRVPGPVNVLALPRAPSLTELARLGAARVSYGTLLHRGAMEQFSRVLDSLTATPAG